MKKLCYILLSFFMFVSAKAQITNNDCLTSRSLCGNLAFVSDNLNGMGNNDFAPPLQNSWGCVGGGESQSAWYSLTVQNSGTLMFDILPIANNDYDFAVYGPNKPCNALGTPIRCNFAGQGPPPYSTGLSDTPGNGYEAPLNVIAGETYYIFINNFSNTNSGFGMNIGGTAGLVATNTTDFTFTVGCNIAKFINASKKCGSILSYSWTFGDGSPITAENFKPDPTHYYEAIGDYTVTLTVTDAADVSFSASVSKTIQITKIPVPAQITGLGSNYCISASPVPLTGTPSGGVFSIKKNQTGNFTTQTVFNPFTLGAGLHDVKYTYQDPNDLSCISVKLQTVRVSNAPALSLSNIQDNYCITAAPFTLQGFPAGGTFKVDDVPKTIFDPTALGGGMHIVRYDYTDPETQCANFLLKSVTVRLPSEIVIAFPNLKSAYCIGASTFQVQATPVGGTIKIDDNNTNIFNPNTLGIGIHTVSYTYTNGFGCTNTKVQQVEITDKPALAFIDLQDSYCINAPAFTLQASPSGGVFKIGSTAATQFNPNTLGDYVISYTYTNPTNTSCFNTIQKTVKVYPLPALTTSGFATKYCTADDLAVQPQVSITLADGSVVVQNPTELAFNPATLGAGNHVKNYTFIDPLTNCPNNTSIGFTVYANPTLSFIDLPDTYCEQAFPIDLEASPSGGIFKVDGNPTTQFLPASFAVGAQPIITYSYTDAEGCSNLISKQVSITANPIQPTSESYTLCPNAQTGFAIEALTEQEENTFKTQGIIPAYYWKNQSITTRQIPIDDVSKGGAYEVWVRDEEGCFLKKKTFQVNIDCEAVFFVPTAFTPNGDALNPLLKIYGNHFAKLRFYVYNRWGEIVFTARRKEEGWDGNINGKPAPAGVYTWKATYENAFRQGEAMSKQGQFVLIR